jgi:hypothetical protein
VKVAPPVIGAIGSLKVAVMLGLNGTLVALSSGVTAVTTGGSAAMPPPPRMGSRSPLHPVAKATSSNAMDSSGFVTLRNRFIGFLPFRLFFVLVLWLRDDQNNAPNVRGS